MSMYNGKSWPVFLRSEGWQSGHNGKAGRPWAHLLPRAHQKYHYAIVTNCSFLWEGCEDWQKRFSTNKDRRNYKEMGRRGRDAVRTHPLGRWPAKGRVITIAEVLPKEQGAWGPHQALQPGGPAQGRWAPKTSGFEDQRGLHMGKPEDYRK